MNYRSIVTNLSDKLLAQIVDEFNDGKTERTAEEKAFSLAAEDMQHERNMERHAAIVQRYQVVKLKSKWGVFYEDTFLYYFNTENQANDFTFEDACDRM